MHNAMIRPKLRHTNESIMERAIGMSLTKINSVRMHLGINLHLGINYLSKTCNIKGDVLLVPEIENNTHNKE